MIDPEVIQFRPWPKIGRLNRRMIVTEKIDGSNACVIVTGTEHPSFADQPHCLVETADGDQLAVLAQSRKNLISPSNDNFGFARWVWENAEKLAGALGVGYHFGEWYGSGIQRGYGLQKGQKRFMLFNVERWGEHRLELDGISDGVIEVSTVLYDGRFNSSKVNHIVNQMRKSGSAHVPGFSRPEGVIAFHVASNTAFKVLLNNDQLPKGVT